MSPLLVLGLRHRGLRRRDTLGRLGQRGARGAIERSKCLILLHDLAGDDSQLAAQRGQARALLIGFERLASSFDLDEHVAAPHATAKCKIRGGNAAADGGAHHVHAVRLKARGRADVVD